LTAAALRAPAVATSAALVIVSAYSGPKIFAQNRAAADLARHLSGEHREHVARAGAPRDSARRPDLFGDLASRPGVARNCGAGLVDRLHDTPPGSG